MTTAPVPVLPEAVTLPEHGTGERRQRRIRRRRLFRQQLAVVLVMAAILLVTLVLLGLQWLHSGGPQGIITPPGAVGAR